MKKGVLLIIILLVLAGGGFWLYRSRSQAISVEAARVERKVLQKTVTASGELETSKKAELAFEVTGKVASVSARVGERVKKNRVLASLDTRDLKESLNQVRASLDKHLEARREFRAEHETDSPSNELFAQLAQYDASVRNAQAQVEAARLNLQKATLTSPIAGTVTEVNIEEGEIIRATSGTAITVANLSPENIYFKAEIDEEDLSEEITVGEKVIITLDAAGSRTFEGRIKKLAPQTTLNEAGDTVLEAEIAFTSNSSSPAVPEKYQIRGLSGDAEIVVAWNEGAPTVPIEALIEENGEKYVWKIVNGRAKKTTVKTGLETEFEIAVTSRLNAGDLVATDNLDKLKDGQKVVTP